MEIKVVAYGAGWKAAMEKTVRTAGKPYALKLQADRTILAPDGQDHTYINASVVDKDGSHVPDGSRTAETGVEGAGKFRAMANGTPTCLEPFHIPRMHLFRGQPTP